jgi:TPR repeat protein
MSSITATRRSRSPTSTTVCISIITTAFHKASTLSSQHHKQERNSEFFVAMEASRPQADEPIMAQQSASSSSSTKHGSNALEKMLQCPILQDVVKDPVLLIAGKDAPLMYDRQALCGWLSVNPHTEPTTRCQYDEKLYYVDSLLHRDLLRQHYGEQAFVPYKTPLEFLNEREIKVPGLETTLPQKSTPCSKYELLQALLSGMNRQQIDRRKALRLCEQGEAQGDPILQAYRALILWPTKNKTGLNKSGSSSGVAKDGVKSLETWNRAISLGSVKLAESGDPYAQHSLGTSFFHGIGTAVSHGTAVEWYRKAAEQGLGMAQSDLGQIYENGHDGVVTKDITIPYLTGRDITMAVEWYRKAAEQGLAQAQTNLGAMYAYGRGVAKDKKMAVDLWRKAAMQGLSVAQDNLGRAYMQSALELTWMTRWLSSGIAEQPNRAIPMLDLI